MEYILPVGVANSIFFFNLQYGSWTVTAAFPASFEFYGSRFDSGMDGLSVLY